MTLPDLLTLATPNGPVLVRGAAACGKTALLADARERFGPDVIVVDDAHRLTDSELAELTHTVDCGKQAVVIATEPRPHHAGLRALIAAVARKGTVVDVPPVTAAEVARLADGPISRADAAAIAHLCGGSRAGALALLAARRTGTDLADAAGTWIRDRMRRDDPDMLATLALAAAGAGLDPADVADVIGVEHAEAEDLVDRVRASGLLADADVLLPAAVEPLRGTLGSRRFAGLQTGLFEVLSAAATLRPETAATFADLGVRDTRLADFLIERAATAAPDVATELYAAAVRAGADPVPVALPYANAAALAGDFATAQALADEVLARPDTTDADLAYAVRILGSVWAQRGRLDRCAELYAWLGPQRVEVDAGLAAAVLYAVGRPGDAERMTGVGTSGPPTEYASAVAALGSAVGRSMAGPAGPAVTELVRLTSNDRPPTQIASPLDPVAIAILLCLHNGEIERAAALAERTSATPSRVLLRAWTSFLAGDDDAAAASVATLADVPLGARDQLLTHGIGVGLARRSGDRGALATAWAAAQRVLDEVAVDIFVLLPLGELWLASVRVGESRQTAHLIDEATDLLNRLGGPQAWANTFHWYGIQAALLADQPAAFVPHARALSRAAEYPDPYAATLAVAGRTWLRVLRGEADAVEIEESAQLLGRVGLPWDGARLASEGALRAADTTTATTLLQSARNLRQRSAPSAPETAASGPLSDRESEVAALLVLGLTYREVGARLFISAKTVEHHVARIRRRLGAGSRSELLSMLRALGHGDQ